MKFTLKIDVIPTEPVTLVAIAGHGEAEVDVIAVYTAQALAEAVAQADVFCEASGGDDTMACGLAEVDVRAVASAQVRHVVLCISSGNLLCFPVYFQ